MSVEAVLAAAADRLHTIGEGGPGPATDGVVLIVDLAERSLAEDRPTLPCDDWGLIADVRSELGLPGNPPAAIYGSNNRDGDSTVFIHPLFAAAIVRAFTPDRSHQAVMSGRAPEL